MINKLMDYCTRWFGKEFLSNLADKLACSAARENQANLAMKLRAEFDAKCVYILVGAIEGGHTELQNKILPHLNVEVASKELRAIEDVSQWEQIMSALTDSHLCDEYIEALKSTKRKSVEIGPSAVGAFAVSKLPKGKEPTGISSEHGNRP